MKISLFGHFETLNLRNEATLLAMVSRLRLVCPNWEICCICTDPEDVTARHGIKGVPHTARFRRLWDRRLSLHNRLGMLFFGLSEGVRRGHQGKRTIRQPSRGHDRPWTSKYELLFEEELGQLRLAETETAEG